MSDVMQCLNAFLSLLLITLVTATSSADPAPAVITHDNQHPAGTMKDGTLLLNLRAGAGTWHPEGAQAPGLSIDAFAEGDGPLMSPAPLIRVPEGTTIAATITNTLTADLQVHGLCEHSDTANAPGAAACATVTVPSMATRKVQFAAGRPGAYLWWASSAGVPLQVRYGRDSQLSGAFIVDPAGKPREADRVFVVTEWTSLSHDQLAQAFKSDDPFATAISFRPKFATLINAKSWPNTERLTYRVGDLVKWRIINASPESHPMHLHGFYYYVDSIGDGMVDRPFSRDRKPHVVTQLVPPGTTMSLTWMPERAGNWLFHCHIMEHVSPDRALTPHDPTKSDHDEHQHHDVAAGMAGMVLGIQVLERPQTTATGDGPGPDASDWCPVDGVEPTVRKLTLAMRGEGKTYGFSLVDGVTPPSASLTVPGPTLVLRRDQPVEINLVNQLPEATAVHWHGMELDSYYDGVHGFSGLGHQTTPMIEPGATFTVKFTPPRTGTFIYHTHVHDERQLTAGLYGALLVVEPGAAASFDPDTDHPLVIGRDGVGPAPTMVLNGSTKPQFSWHAGVKHRLRLVNITRHDIVNVTLMGPAGPVQWRPLTKDGAPVPTADNGPREARQKIAVGETYDFEYDAPAMRQSLWIEIRDEAGDWRVQGHAVLK
jgi:FtsP/CotA-like multicopper oxidase with cupredoxin domain